MNKLITFAFVLLFTLPGMVRAADRPNVVILFADDISARELPIYGSSVWSPPLRGDTSEPQYRASTPVLDQMANEGCWIKTAWASVVCSPSRAMMMRITLVEAALSKHNTTTRSKLGDTTTRSTSPSSAGDWSGWRSPSV